LGSCKAAAPEDGKVGGQHNRHRRTKKLKREEVSDNDALLAELEDEVRDAVTNGTDDLVLAKLVEITARSIRTNRELFPDLLTEPAFYARYFRPWVQAAMDEDAALDNFHANALEALGIKKPSRE